MLLTLLSYLMETKDTVTRLQEISVIPDKLLDVESLYTNIYHDLGIKAAQHFLSTNGTQFQWHNQSTLTLLLFLLTIILLLMANSIIRQEAPLWAFFVPQNVQIYFQGGGRHFFGQFSCLHHLYHLLGQTQYIDNILILWEGDQVLFVDFVPILNHNEMGMKFTYEIQSETLNYLDLIITLADDGSVVTEGNFH